MNCEDVINGCFDYVMFMSFSESGLNIMNKLEIYSCPGFSSEMQIPQIQSFLEETDQLAILQMGKKLKKKILIMVYLILTV